LVQYNAQTLNFQLLADGHRASVSNYDRQTVNFNVSVIFVSLANTDDILSKSYLRGKKVNIKFIMD
jgi:hypothetical protein